MTQRDACAFLPRDDWRIVQTPGAVNAVVYTPF